MKTKMLIRCLKKNFKRKIVVLLKSTEQDIQELKKCTHNTDEKFFQEIQILKRDQPEIIEIKSPRCQIENTMESLLTTDLVKQKKEH